MSKYSNTINNDKVECPYCGYSYQREGEDISEDEREEECEECGKKYQTHDSFTVYHHAAPDCELNGEQHDYQPASLGNGKTHPFCTVCEKCQPHRELK